MFNSRSRKLQENIGFSLTCLALTAALVGVGLLGQHWQHERRVESRQIH
jgi:hypothetical protein